MRLLLLSAITTLISSQTYEMTGNPYKSSSDLSRKVGSVDLREHNMVHNLRGSYTYPEQSGTYPFIFMVGGMFSIFPEFVYSDMIEKLAKKGFIVAYNLCGEVWQSQEGWTEVLDFHKNNASRIMSEATNGSIKADTSKFGLICHSAGCQTIIGFLKDRADVIDAVVMADSVPLKDYDIGEPGSIHLPNTVVAIESTEHCARCCMQNNKLNATMDAINTPKLKLFTKVNHMGHCSILNLMENRICLKTNFCIMEEEYTKTTKVNQYHECFVGKNAAMFTDGFFESIAMRTYYQDLDAHCKYDYDMEDMGECEGSFCV